MIPLGMSGGLHCRLIVASVAAVDVRLSGWDDAACGREQKTLNTASTPVTV